MPFVAKNDYQLNRPEVTTDQVDCGPRSTRVAMRWAARRNTDVPSIPTIRLWMGRPTGTTNVWTVKASLDAFSRSRAWLNFGDDQVVDALKAGRAVSLSISYRKWNQVAKRTGQSDFLGGHQVLIVGRWKNDAGKWVTRLYDSLEDGRRAGVPESPKGRVVNLAKVMQSARAFGGGNGQVYSVIIGRK